MNNLKNKINTLISFYKSTLNNLELITENNFFENLNNAKASQIAADNLKNELLSGYERKELQEFELPLIEITKQINTAFDNILADKNIQLLAAASGLESAQNQKKLIGYER